MRAGAIGTTTPFAPLVKRGGELTTEVNLLWRRGGEHSIVLRRVVPTIEIGTVWNAVEAMSHAAAPGANGCAGSVFTIGVMAGGVGVAGSLSAVSIRARMASTASPLFGSRPLA
jgi:hypothetical protein